MREKAGREEREKEVRDACRVRKRVFYSLELELLKVMSFPVWVLGTELRFSERVASALDLFSPWKLCGLRNFIYE